MTCSQDNFSNKFTIVRMLSEKTQWNQYPNIVNLSFHVTHIVNLYTCHLASDDLHLYMYLHISWKRQVKLHHLKKPFHTAIIFSQINHQWKLLWQGRELIKKRTFENWENYKRQQNSCINLSQKMKHDYFTNLHVKNKSDSKSFCSKSQFHNISRNILNSNIH